MHRIRVTSVLPVAFRDELERIVFFNPEQGLVTGPLVDTVHRYGVLYALDQTAKSERLVGVAMFVREPPSTMVILHLAAHEDYTSKGRWAEAYVITRLIAAIRSAAMSTHGIETLRILYPHEIRLNLREVSRRPLASRSNRHVNVGR
jgi:hypothetical protein